MSLIPVLCVEDDPIVQERILAALRADSLLSVTVASTLAEARLALHDRPPRVLVTDLQLPDGHANELIREVAAGEHPPEILVISVFGDERSVVAAIAAGATGYLLKDSLPNDISRTVHDLLAGTSPLSPAVARYLLRSLQKPSKAAAGDPVACADGMELTPRERDILTGIAKGFTCNELADALGLSRQTVPSYVKRLYRKLQVGNRGEAVYEATLRGLLKF